MTVEYTLYAILIVLVIIAGLLAGLLMTRTPDKAVEVELIGVDTAIERLKRAVEHHVDVSAVLGLMKQLERHPNVIEELQSYPETVRAAAWLHYINLLGADLQVAQVYLSKVQQGKIDGGYDKSRRTKLAQEEVNAIRNKLDAAIAASGQKTGPRPV